MLSIEDDLHRRLTKQLRTPGTRTPNFYGLPKLHKNPLKIRPIVSSILSPTYYLALFIHFTLWPTIIKHPSTLINSTDLLTNTRNLPLTHNSVLMTMDVVSLYASIKHIHSLQALAWHLRQQDIPGPWRAAVVKIMRIILNNYFTFNGSTYHQLRGTAMGSPAAVANANIFMFRMEKYHLTTFFASSLLAKRYIDYLFAITVEERIKQNLVDEPIRTNCPVRFTHETSKIEIIMLDLKLSIHNNAIESKINFKQTNKFQYISPRSSHPYHTWKAVALGEMIRAGRGSTNEAASLGTRSFLAAKLIERGYSKSVVSAALSSTHRKRPTHSKNNTTPPLTTTPPLILPYLPYTPLPPRSYRSKHGVKTLWTKHRLDTIIGQTPFIAWKRQKVCHSSTALQKAPTSQQTCIGTPTSKALDV